MRSAYLWPGRVLLAVPSLFNAPHRHLGASVLIGVDAPFRLDVAGRSLRCRAAVVAPDVEQSLHAEGPLLALQVDPDQPAYRQHLAPLLGADRVVLPDPDCIDIARRCFDFLSLRASGCAEADRLLQETLLGLGLGGARSAARPLDPRIDAIAGRLREARPARLDPSPLVSASGLSHSRLMHLFKDEIGVSMRRFVAGIRVQHALMRLRAARNLTHLAHETGFYDLAHLSQACRAHAGTTLSGLLEQFAHQPGRVFACVEPHEDCVRA